MNFLKKHKLFSFAVISFVVLSGANAGGKTVALKTVALIALMNQCGLPLPVKEASLPVFRHIFVEIGDEISHDLSLPLYLLLKNDN